MVYVYTVVPSYEAHLKRGHLSTKATSPCRKHDTSIIFPQSREATSLIRLHFWCIWVGPYKGDHCSYIYCALQKLAFFVAVCNQVCSSVHFMSNVLFILTKSIWTVRALSADVSVCNFSPLKLPQTVRMS